MQIVSSAKDFKVVAVGNERLREIVYLFGFLGLTSSHTEDHVSVYIEVGLASDVAFDANQASLFGMLEVKAVALGNLAVHGLLDPGHFVYEGVAIALHEFDGKAILCVDDPDEEET